MLNSNSGIDHSSARAFGSSFPAGQNQNGANAFGLAGLSYDTPDTCMHGKTVILSILNVQAAYQDSRTTTCRVAYKIGKFCCCCRYLARTESTLLGCLPVHWQAMLYHSTGCIYNTRFFLALLLANLVLCLDGMRHSQSMNITYGAEVHLACLPQQHSSRLHNRTDFQGLTWRSTCSR